MKGKTLWKLGLILFLCGPIILVSIVILALLVEIPEPDPFLNVVYTYIGILSVIIPSCIGISLLGYSPRKIKTEFLHKLTAIIKEKKGISPRDLQRIEQETFGNTEVFGSARVPVGGGLKELLLNS